jgi:two-component system sensor histidine kinase PilS (NtrC family)
VFETRRLLRWIYLGRLSIATAIFLAAALAWTRADASETLIASLTLVGAIAFTALSIWYSGWRARSQPRPFYLAQAMFDMALVTAVVHTTGGALSQFAALYILVSAYATLLLPGRHGLLVAAFGLTLYAAEVFLVGETVPGLVIVLQLCVLATVAIVTVFLGARLREAGVYRDELRAQLVLARLQGEDILRNIRSGIITIDANGRLLFANPTAGALLGVNAEQVIGRPLDDVLGATAPDLVQALWQTLRRGERVTRGETEVTVDGRRYPLGLTTTLIEAERNPEGRSATVIFQDISDNKRLEALRLRAERLEAVAELSASLAHEIKNPLASIRSAVEQLAQAPKATEDERTLGGLIVRESDRLSRLLSEFLDFARVRATRVAPVNLSEIARAATGLVSSHPDCLPGVEVTCSTPNDPLLVDGDEDLLHRAVFNLALNAVQATPERGRVAVEVGPMPPDQLPRGLALPSDAVAVRVSDTGPGIPKDIRDRVFDPFFTTKVGGTGLGLPIVHRAIEAHRGLVFVDSNGGGTRFTIVLPRSQPHIEASV